MLMLFCVMIGLILLVAAIPVISVSLYYCARGGAKGAPVTARVITTALAALPRH
jgi:hypothetical protein